MKYNYKRLRYRAISREDISQYLNSLEGKILYYKETFHKNDNLRIEMFPNKEYYIIDILVEYIVS